MARITALSLYIINMVRLRRLCLGYSTRELSALLDKSEGYVGMIESSASVTHYPTHEWPKLAEALKCQIHDLLPPDNTDQQSTGALVDKVILDLSNAKDMQLITEGLIANNYFKQSRTLTDTAKYLHIVNESDQMDTLTQVINHLAGTRQLNQTGELYTAL